MYARAQKPTAPTLGMCSCTLPDVRPRAGPVAPANGVSRSTRQSMSSGGPRTDRFSRCLDAHHISTLEYVWRTTVPTGEGPSRRSDDHRDALAASAVHRPHSARPLAVAASAVPIAARARGREIGWAQLRRCKHGVEKKHVRLGQLSLIGRARQLVCGVERMWVGRRAGTPRAHKFRK